MTPSASNGSGQTPAALATTPDYGPMSHMTHPTAHLSSMGMIPSSSPTTQMGVLDQSAFRRVSGGSTESSAPFWTNLPQGPGLIGQKSLPPNPYTSLPVGSNFGFPPRQDMLPPPAPSGHPSNRSEISGNNRNQPSPFVIPFLDSAHSSRSPKWTGRRSLPTGPPNSFTRPIQTPLVGQTGKNRHMSLPPSRAGSVGPDDILAPDEIINPLGAMSNMAGLVEAAVERAREEQLAKESPDSAGMSNKRTPGESTNAVDPDGTPSRPVKRARFSPPPPTGPAVVESQDLPPISGQAKGKAKSKKTHVHAYPDAVAEGYVTEEEGEQLMQM